MSDSPWTEPPRSEPANNPHAVRDRDETPCYQDDRFLAAWFLAVVWSSRPSMRPRRGLRTQPGARLRSCPSGESGDSAPLLIDDLAHVVRLRDTRDYDLDVGLARRRD